jgi:hypothetical protein
MGKKLLRNDLSHQASYAMSVAVVEVECNANKLKNANRIAKHKDNRTTAGMAPTDNNPFSFTIHPPQFCFLSRQFNVNAPNAYWV